MATTIPQKIQHCSISKVAFDVSDDDIKFESFSSNIMRRDRDGAAGGGLLIYVRDGIGISRIRNLETSLDETIWVLIQGKGRSFLLCNTYRSDYSDNQYWTRLKHAIEMAFEINPNVVITSDRGIFIYLPSIKRLP